MKAGLTPTPRVVGISLKDRSAILMTGRRADALAAYEVATRTAEATNDPLALAEAAQLMRRAFGSG